MRQFNTSGAIKPELHYCIPPLERIDETSGACTIHVWGM